jgi:hypothetical protein
VEFSVHVELLDLGVLLLLLFVTLLRLPLLVTLLRLLPFEELLGIYFESMFYCTGK